LQKFENQAVELLLDRLKGIVNATGADESIVIDFQAQEIIPTEAQGGALFFIETAMELLQKHFVFKLKGRLFCRQARIQPPRALF
jgi:hypothetical protein